MVYNQCRLLCTAEVLQSNEGLSMESEEVAEAQAE